MAELRLTPYLKLDGSNGPITESLDVVDDTMADAVAGAGDEFNNIYSEQTNTDAPIALDSSIMSAVRAKTVFDNAGRTTGQMMGMEAECVINSGSPLVCMGMKCIIGAGAGATPGYMEIFTGGLSLNPTATTGNSRGLRSDIWIGGAITGILQGADLSMEIVSGATISGYVDGLFVQVDNDGTVGGYVYGIRLDDKTGVDYGFYQNGAAPNRFGGQVSAGGSPPSVNYDLGALNTGILCLKEGTTPTADADHAKIYSKDDNELYFQDGAGVEHRIALDT